jgi:aminoglycoside phosphotransferase (APT) family kinase protein
VPEWSADVAVDEGLARRLIAQFPDLEVESLSPFAEGWDYAIWVVNETWVFRFPRREVAVAGAEREIAVLPALVPKLTLPVPVPVFVGAPADGYPWPFFGSRLLPGRELCDVTLDDSARTRIGVSLAAFLRELHGADLEHDLPIDANGRADMTIRVPKARAAFAEIGRLGLWNRPASVDRLLDAAEHVPPPDLSAVVHGDLHFRQVLADDDARVTGVIDWVDVGRSEPAIDLVLLWSFVPPSGRRAFLDEYGPVSEAQLLRARVLAIWLSAVLAQYGHIEGMRNVEREAVQGLERSVTS